MNINSETCRQLLEQALASPPGLRVSTTDPEHLRRNLAAERAELRTKGLSLPIIFLRDPASPFILYLVHREEFKRAKAKLAGQAGRPDPAGSPRPPEGLLPISRPDVSADTDAARTAAEASGPEVRGES